MALAKDAIRPEIGMGATEMCWSDRHPWTVVAVYSENKCMLQRGRQAREEGHYTESLKELESGLGLLENAEMSLQLGVVWAHFGRTEEAVAILKRGLQHSSSDLSLNRALVEVYYQTGKWKVRSGSRESWSGTPCRAKRP